MYLNRDVSSGDQPIEGDDTSPVDVPNKFRECIQKAREIALDACKALKIAEYPKRSAIDFWCDMVQDLDRIEQDIMIVTDRNLGDENE